ncbi:MAG: helix-turn-helix transcriptional regulator [Lachnospiraceae bacterium]|nr:helix-turn-helix transcriptional regulator [Lachnospiraceae bacterium]
MKNNNNSSAGRLKRLRLSRHMTQEQMAEAIGISESLYKGNESGRLPISKKTAQMIEDYFGISADYIFFGTLRDSQDVWTAILECEESEKMKIMFRLLKYFSLQGTLDFSDQTINNLIKDMKL